MQYLNLKQTIWSFARLKLVGELPPPRMSFHLLISMTLSSRAWFGSISLFLLLSSLPAAPLTCPPSLLSPGDLHAGGSFLALLLPLLFLLGADRGLAVLHGRDGPVTEPHHPQALLVSRMGWGSWLCGASSQGGWWNGVSPQDTGPQEGLMVCRRFVRSCLQHFWGCQEGLRWLKIT